MHGDCIYSLYPILFLLYLSFVTLAKKKCLALPFSLLYLFAWRGVGGGGGGEGGGGRPIFLGLSRMSVTS